MKLRVGSRKSPLARAQAEQAVALLCQHHPEIEIEWIWITTSGDRFQERPLFDIGGKGLFIKEIEQALLAGEIDFAIHSGKDLPAYIPEELNLVATPPRENPFDVLCSKQFRFTDPSGTIGTSSPRRAAQLKDRYPHLNIVALRGNVETRLNAIHTGQCDGVILATAGLHRLGNPWQHYIEPLEWMIPATAQGTLVFETRTDNVPVKALLNSIHDEQTWHCFCVERAVQAAVGGDCFLPFAVHATMIANMQTKIRAALWLNENGQATIKDIIVANDSALAAAVELGRSLR